MVFVPRSTPTRCDSPSRPARVAVIADLLHEGWPSMDLMAEMVILHAGRDSGKLTTVLQRPAFRTLPSYARNGAPGTPSMVERIAHRFWSYPRWLRRQPPADVYHIVDHSYAHLAHELPQGRVIVTCHDTDAFRRITTPRERESWLPGYLVRRVLSGLQRAAAVVCDSETTRADLVANRLVDASHTLVIPIGVHPSCSAAPDPDSDAAADALTPAGGTNLLHVGSTIPRKRIDLLLECLAQVVRARPDVRLWRVGGAFTADQARLARQLDVEQHIVVLPFVTRPVLAALYRRAALVVLPSSREGFGLPVVEAMGCGTPVLCSDLPVLREVGGAAAEYCIGPSRIWAARVLSLLEEREKAPASWSRRRAQALARAAEFSWDRYASAMERVYLQVAERTHATLHG